MYVLKSAYKQHFFYMIANNNLSKKQQTLSSDISLKGIGLHSGKEVNITIEPANINNGIKFIRKDLFKNNIIEALWSNVSSTNLCTTIRNEKGASVSTVEHLMSALSGLHIDNVNILIDSVEVPIMDGSSLPFVESLEISGILTQEEDRKTILVNKEIMVSNKDSYAKITPNKQFSIDFAMEFEIPKPRNKLPLAKGLQDHRRYKKKVGIANKKELERKIGF